MYNTTNPIYLDRPVNVWGLVVLIIFYLVILALGIWTSIKKKVLTGGNAEDLMVAGRNVAPILGIFTMTATWVGGGYINGTAEYVFTPGYGLAWTQAMWGFTGGLIVSGLFYARKMRACRYVTLLDPFKHRYGEIVGALMALPPMLSELFWASAILSALGASLAVILGVAHETGVLISAGVAICYTVFGGLYSVVVTDVVQLICMAIGLWLGVGFSLANPAVKNIGTTALGKDGWVGILYPDAWVGNWIDNALLLILGGVPWQCYFQRVLSARTPRGAQILSFAAAGGCIFFSIPSVLIGAIAKSTDWNATDFRLYGPIPLESKNYPLILPLVLEHLTPQVVSVIGLGAISAAVMSSADSSLLSSSSMFAWNVYKPIRTSLYPRKKPSDMEIVIIMRVTIVILGVLASVIAIQVLSVYGLFLLCGDFAYSVAFPQLTCVLFYKHANALGAVAGYIVSFFFRLTAGEPFLNFPPLIKYPNFDEETQTQLFPIRTLAMLLGLITIIGLSYLTRNMPIVQKFRMCDPKEAIQEDDEEEKEKEREGRGEASHQATKMNFAFENKAMSPEKYDTDHLKTNMQRSERSNGMSHRMGGGILLSTKM